MRQFNYLCCFTANIATLRDEARALDDATKGLQGRVDSERDNVRVIVPTVETWLTDSKEIMDEMNRISNEATNVGSGCFKLRDRFSLSKRAKKTTDRMKELQGWCNFDVISYPGPPPARMTTPLGVNTYEFESRKQIEEDIMTSLRGEDVNMIGICGMGGLGKTTMAKMIMNRASAEHLFQEVVMAVVSQSTDKLKIQDEIAGSLGLDLKGETSMAGRVQKLHSRLTESTKRILLVLDDVWESLELEELGIPYACKGCTILLTSRNRDVLRAMNVGKVFGMKVLSEEEAWFLFRERVGTCVDETKLISLAEQVVEECRGLPIALTTVGAALKDENDACIWKDALRQLKQGNPDIEGIIAEVYNPLKLSYDALGSKHAKSVFLLCCLFPEDANICLKYLTCFCMGLGIFEEGIRKLEEARNRMRALIQMLKNRYLLLEGRNEDYVRMHDVVRDVSIFIAQKEGYIGHNDSTWISSSSQFVRERDELPAGLRNLRLLVLIRNSVDKQFKLDNTFLEGIRDLQVLSIENYPSLKSLPRTTESLKNLNTLILDSCWGLDTISFVGELVSLEIFICHDCGSIEELPPEIKGLNRLKLLELTRCHQLKRMGSGIISSLVRLEELKMLGSFQRWGIQEGENVNAGLRELEALTNLTSLEIEIVNPEIVEKMQLSSKLERFQISIHAVKPSPFHSKWERSIGKMNEDWDGARFDKKMSVRGLGETCFRDWVERLLLSDTECLRLIGNVATNVDLAKTQNIRWLMVDECEAMKNIGRTTTMDGATVFPFIEHLSLLSLPQLEEILDGPISSNSFHNLNELTLFDLPALKQLWKSSSLRRNNYVPVFSNLSSIVISACPHLPNLGQLSISGVGCLPQLQILRVSQCEMMKQVFLWNEDDENKNSSEIRNRHITKSFPKLKEVVLSDLPNLATLYQGIEGIEFPLLTKMRIEECPKMTSMVSSNENDSGDTSNPDDIDDDHSSHLFCQPQTQKVSFGSLQKLFTHQNPFCGHEILVSSFNGLEKLEIFGYKGSVRLFTSSIARNFVSLKILSIRKCDEMVQVIQDEEGKTVSDGQKTILFPNLQELELSDLRKLVRFCEWKGDVELPSLSQVVIVKCPKMTNFTSGQGMSAIEQLQIQHIEECEMMEQVFLCNEEDDQRNIDTTLAFSELTSLSLKSLPKLTNLCKGIESFEFPQLTQIQVKECPLLVDKVFSLNLFFESDKVKMDIWNNQPFRNAEYLSLEGNACRNLDFRVVQNMRLLTLGECSMGKKLVNMTTMDTHFPHLEVLRLVKLTELEEIWDIDAPIQSHSFKNLKELRFEFLPKLKHLWQGSSSPSEMSVVSIFSKLFSLYIYGCHELCNLFSLSVTFTSSCLLEELVIESCDRMEQVFIWNEGETQSNIRIPKLKILILDSLPKLTSFCKGTESFEFPLLNQKRISRCPLLKNFVCTDWSPEDRHDDSVDDYTHLFCKPDNKENMKLKLQGNMSLARNRIQECVEYMSLEEDGSTSLDFGVAQSMRCLTLREFSMNMTTITTVFPLLEVLCLVNITELEEIWDIDGPQHLNELRLKSLPALKHLWQIRSSSSQMNVDVSIFNKLSCIYIYGCHRLCNLFPLSMMGKGSCLLQLETLVIESCDEMEQLFSCNEEDNERNIDTTLVFPELKSLSLKSLPKLTSLCIGIESFEFPRLTQIQLKDCPLLNEKVFPMNLFYEPDKVKIEIWNNQPFRNAEYLSLEGNAYRNLDVRKVQNMRWLIFRECLRGTKLVSVTTMDTLFPRLEVLRLLKLTELEEIWDIDGPNSFQNLKELRLEFLPALKHLWPSEVVSIFNKLSCIYIYGCHKLCNLFSLPVTETNSYLLQLEELVIESCDMIEYVFFWNEGENQSNFQIPKLKVLVLDSLPKLTSFCKGTKKIEFPLLDRKRISRCPLLENFVSTDWPPDDHGHNIHLFCELDNELTEVEEKMELKLQGNITLGRNRIQECVEYMSLDDSASFDFGVAESMRCLTFREFPMGTKLMNITTLATLFHCVKVLTFRDCLMEKKLMNMRTIATPFPLLEDLCLVNIKELVEIWDIDGPQHLNELRLKSLPALKHLWKISSSPSQMNDVSIFNKLSSIYIYECHRLCNLFSLPIMRRGSCLLQLERLVIGNCEMMEQVFLWNEEQNQTSVHIPLVFPKLKVLKLDSLPMLTSFCDGTESFKFPLLVEMRISRCPLLENLVHDDDSTHLFCKPDKALKHLWKIRSGLYEKNVVSIFNQISSICIYGCDGLLHLFSLSMMVKGSCLLQLERIEIESCKKMEQVFLWNEEKNIHVHQFPKLKFLSLSFLPKLRNICKGVERIQCPQLDKMKIINCPLLESLVYWDKKRTFIFNSLRSSQLQRGKGANTALQPHMLKIEEQQQQQQQVEEEQRKTITEEERRCEIEEEPDS